jgi:hypothetical protein
MLPGARRGRRSDGRSWRRRRAHSGAPLGTLLLALVVVGSVFAFGAQHTPVLVLVALCSAAAAVLLPAQRVPLPSWLLGALALYTLLQIVPLPFAWVAALSPGSAEVWRGSLSPFREALPRFVTLSVDPAATALEALKWSSYACLYAAVRGFQARRGSRPLALLLFLSALAVAVVTLAHGVLDASRIYGFWTSTVPYRWTRGPLVNGNNLAGYLNLGLFAGIGLFLSEKRSPLHWAFIGGIPLLAGSVLLTGSRAGVVALVVGALLIGLFTLSQSRAGNLPRVALGMGGVTLFAAVWAAALAGPELWANLTDRNFGGKVQGMRWSLGMIRDFPVFGVGRGAFETAFQPYRQSLGRDWTTVFAHAENFLLDWVAEWGVPVALGAFAAGLWFARRPLRRALRDPIAAGLMTGLALLFLHNLADFALELCGVAVAAIVAFAAADEQPTLEGPTNARTVAPLAAGVAVSMVVVLASGATPVQVERHRASRAYAAWVASGSKDSALILPTLRAAMLSHPGEAYFPLLGASVASRSGRDDPLRFLGRALERSPLDGNAHLLLGSVLAQRGSRRQAMLHWRMAARYDVTLRDGALERIGALARNEADLLSAFPNGRAGGELLADACPKLYPALRVTCTREVVARQSTPEARRALVEALITSVEGKHSPCRDSAAEACSREADQLLSGLERGQVARDWRLAPLRARLLTLRGEPGRAAGLLIESCPASSDARECSKQAFELSRRARDVPTLSAAADRYASLACGNPSRCAATHEAIARAFSELDAWGLAVTHFTTAAKEEPSADRFIQAAGAAAELGSRSTVTMLIARARRLGSLSDTQQAEVRRVEERLRDRLTGDLE